MSTLSSMWSAKRRCGHTLVQAIAASDAMEYAIRKAVELGVSAVQPVTTRAQRAATGGTACGAAPSAVAPYRHSPPASNAAATGCPTCAGPSTRRMAASARRTATGIVLAPTRTTAPAAVAQASLDILIGPEGGFTADEVAGATRAGIIPVRLGPRVLRTETAGPAALAAAHALWGDFR
jgi:16S rRNA (uracil1498-N3)-methyltransferase